MDAAPSTLAHILSVLSAPITAEAFAREYFVADPDETPGSLSRRGHSCLAPLVRKGDVHRIGNGGPPHDLFVSANATNATGFQPAISPQQPIAPPEFHIEGGQVVAVERKTLGRLAAAPEQQPATDGTITVENGQLVRVSVKKEVLGPANGLVMQAPQAPAAQPPTPATLEALGTLILEAMYFTPDPLARRRKTSEAFALLAQTPQAPLWLREQFNRLWQQEMQAPAAAPQVAAPAGDPMLVQMQQMIGMFQLFQQMQSQQPPPAPEPPPYRGPAPAYSPPQAPRSAAQEFRDAVTLVRSAVDAGERISEILPPGAEPELDEPEEDTSPRVLDVGPAKLVVGRDGSARVFETTIANLGPALKWVGEQREAIQKNRDASSQHRQLPPGYVEVGPGYVPPPGYVAVPVDPVTMQPIMQAQPEQPPVAEAAPLEALHSNGAPPQRRAWGMPDVSWADATN